VRQAIELRRADLLYLPPYSPDLNPIEKAWSKLKTLLALPRPAHAKHSIRPSLSCFLRFIQPTLKLGFASAFLVYSCMRNALMVRLHSHAESPLLWGPEVTSELPVTRE